MNSKDFFASVEGDDDLYIVDVLLSYIYPRIFVCKNDDNDKFLLYEMSNKDEIDTWLTTRISNEEHVSLKRKETSIQDLYKGKKDVFLLSKIYKENEDVVHISHDNLDFWVNKLPIKPIHVEG